MGGVQSTGGRDHPTVDRSWGQDNGFNNNPSPPNLALDQSVSDAAATALSNYDPSNDVACVHNGREGFSVTDAAGHFIERDPSAAFHDAMDVITGQQQGGGFNNEPVDHTIDHATGKSIVG